MSSASKEGWVGFSATLKKKSLTFMPHLCWKMPQCFSCFIMNNLSLDQVLKRCYCDVYCYVAFLRALNCGVSFTFVSYALSLYKKHLVFNGCACIYKLQFYVFFFVFRIFSKFVFYFLLLYNEQQIDTRSFFLMDL